MVEQNNPNGWSESLKVTQACSVFRHIVLNNTGKTNNLPNQHSACVGRYDE